MSELYPDDLDDYTSELFKWIDEKPVLTMKNQIIKQYGQEFPAIKHISDKTAYAINTLNENRDKPLSIKDIKDAYTAAGKNLEADPSDVNMANFDKYKDAVDDIKQAQSLEGKAVVISESLDLDPSEMFALQVLLAGTIEKTSQDSLIFNRYNERNLYARIMLKLCPAKNLSDDQINEKLKNLRILMDSTNG